MKSQDRIYRERAEQARRIKERLTSQAAKVRAAEWEKKWGQEQYSSQTPSTSSSQT